MAEPRGPLLEPLTFGVKDWLDRFVVNVGMILLGLVVGVLVSWPLWESLPWLELASQLKADDPTLPSAAWWKLAATGLICLVTSAGATLAVANLATRDTDLKLSPAAAVKRLPVLVLANLLLSAPIVGVVSLTLLWVSEPNIAIGLGVVQLLLMWAWLAATWFVVPAVAVGRWPLVSSLKTAFALAWRHRLPLVLSLTVLAGVQALWGLSLHHFLLSDMKTHPQTRLQVGTILVVLQGAVVASLLVVSTSRHFAKLEHS